MRKTAAGEHPFRRKKERDLRFWNRFFGGLLVLSLIPLAILSFYNHASADDFAFANAPHHGWVQSGLPGLLQGIGRQLHWSYTSWQGCYTAVLLGAMDPVALGDRWYALVTYLLVGFLILSNWIFWRELLQDRERRSVCGSIAAWLFSLAMIQLIPRALDMFFWWDGAVNYLPFFGMLLILSALLLRNLRRNGISAWEETAAVLLSFAAMGGNYVTALVNLLVLAGFGILPLVLLEKGERSAGRRRRRCYAGILLCGCAGLAVSVLAPGNLVRMEEEGAEGITSIPAMVIHSVYLAYESVGDNMSILLVLLLLLAAPFLWQSFGTEESACEEKRAGGEKRADGENRACTEEHACGAESFKSGRMRRLLQLPAVPVTAALFGLYAASFAPSVYVYGDGGPMRIEDVRFFYLVTLLALLEWFLLGKLRLCGRLPFREEQDEGGEAESGPNDCGTSECISDACGSGAGRKEKASERRRSFLSSVLVLTACFVLFCYVLPRENRERLTSLCAARSLLIGEAQQYDAEMRERLALLEDPALDGEDVTVPAFTVRPYLLFLYGLELTEDPSYWINETVAEYYDKGSVTLAESAAE